MAQPRRSNKALLLCLAATAALMLGAACAGVTLPWQATSTALVASGTLEAVSVADLDGQVRHLEADRLLPFFGLSTDLGPLAAWPLNLYDLCAEPGQQHGADGPSLDLGEVNDPYSV